MIEGRTWFLLIVLALGTIGAARAGDGEPVDGGGAGEAPVEFSQAERVLWMTDQLHMIDRPIRLVYEFEKSGSFEEGFKDVVDMEIVSLNDDRSKNAHINFFTGERNHFVPEQEGITVNPVLGIYLQGDTYEMERLTRGSWRYFHRSLKQAIADAAEVQAVEIQFEGRKVAGTRIHIVPYANDPRSAQMKEFAAKEYDITVSDGIPGYLYEVRSYVPAAAGENQPAAAPPLVQEVMRLVQAKPF
ncbi:MAG: hypothetical protein IT495_19730 [Gammaproteobacteria bacterium]|nr:hypothetical protein [Gammaproteobacteria bacterium]